MTQDVVQVLGEYNRIVQLVSKFSRAHWSAISIGRCTRLQIGDPGRLTASLAESICVRASIKPATFPFKIWASYKFVQVGP